MKILRGETFNNREGRRIINVVSDLLTDTEHSIICPYGHSHNTMLYARICEEEFERAVKIKEAITKGLVQRHHLL